jgi:hypothetical protein
MPERDSEHFTCHGGNMSHARGWASMTLATILTLSGCATDATAPPKPDYDYDPTCFGNGTNVRAAAPLGAISRGTGDLSLSVRPPGTPHQLEQVIVYGSPVQRPYRGYGDITTYGGTTTTYTYNRDELDQCSFGDGRTGIPVGAVVDDTLDVPIEAPDGIPEDIWTELTPRVKRQLLEAAYYLADYFLLNDFPEIGVFSREARRGWIFAVLVKGFRQSQETAPDRRRATLELVLESRQSRNLSFSELLRLDAFLLGCSTAAQFRNLNSWTAEQAESWASRVVAGWAADQTENGAIRYLEPHLSMLGALGAAAGREGNSCAQTAEHHFRQVRSDLFDPGSVGGGSGTEF